MDDFESMLKYASIDELRDFIAEYSQADPCFSDAVSDRFCDPEHDPAVGYIGDMAKSEIEDALFKRGKRWGGTDLDLGEIERQIVLDSDNGYRKLAFAQAMAVYRQLVWALDYEDKDEISEVLDSFLDTVEDMGRKAGEANRGYECEYILDRCLELADGEGADNGDRFMQIASHVVTESRRKAFEEAIARHNHSGIFAAIHLDAIARLDGQAGSEAFVAKNLDSDAIRLVACNEAMAQGDWDKAAKLCLERPNPDTLGEADWAKRLFAAYGAAGKKPEMAQAAEALLLLGNFDYYDRLKAIRNDLGDWEGEYPRILEAIKPVKSYRYGSVYMNVLSVESELAPLLEAVRSEPKSVYDYGAQLATKYPDEVAALFSEQISKV